MRTTVSPVRADDGINWTADKFETLVVERLGNGISDDYDAFRNKITKISGINSVVRKELGTTMISEIDAQHSDG